LSGVAPPSIARILLVRHGPSALVHDGRWIDAAGVRRYHAAYDAAGIVSESSPPSGLVAEAAAAQTIVSSDLPRALESAERLAPGRDITASPLLRETHLAIPRWAIGRLPLLAWSAVLHLHWGYRIMRGMDVSSVELAQAEAAADWLGTLAGESRTIVAVTHGVFRRNLANRLALRGWHMEPGRRPYHNWSVWAFQARPFP